MIYPLVVLYEALRFQKSKLNSEIKVWEIEVKLKIEQKISELERAIKLLKKNKDEKE
jgi:hypothetical protein